MKRILLVLLATFGFSQTAEWIYYNNAGDTNSAYRIKPDGTENELIMENAVISDISEDGLKILFDTNGIILLVDTESMDTLTVEMLRHYANDAGKTKDEIDRITEPEFVMQFTAEGVLIER